MRYAFVLVALTTALAGCGHRSPVAPSSATAGAVTGSQVDSTSPGGSATSDSPTGTGSSGGGSGSGGSGSGSGAGSGSGSGGESDPCLPSPVLSEAPDPIPCVQVTPTPL